MFDKVNFQILDISPINNFGEKSEIMFANRTLYKKHSKLFKGICYEGYYENIHIIHYIDRVNISVSLPSLLYGHNANDLCLSELKIAVTKISKTFNVSLENLIITKIEFGFTVQIETNPKNILNRLKLHLGKEGKKEIRKTNTTGVKFYHHQYTIKAYDKGKIEKYENNLSMKGDWLRIEVAYKKVIFPKGLTNAHGLYSREILELIFNDFIKKWDQIIKQPYFNHISMTDKKRYEIYAKYNPLYFEDRLDYVTKEAIKKEKYRFKMDMNTIGDFSIFNSIGVEMKKKFCSLINNERLPQFSPILLGENRGQNKQ